MAEQVKLIGAGDLFMTRRIAADGYEGLEEMKELILQHDIRFVNLEMTFHNEEGFPAAVSGGTWAMTDPVMLDDVLSMGFNLFNTANNHTGDYGTGGVLGTIRHLKERNMVFAGSGRNLGEASQAAYLETRRARVALIGVSASLSQEDRAGGQSDLLAGRPGLNPMRKVVRFHVDPEHYRMAEELANVTHVNDQKAYSIKNGYTPPYPDGVLPFGAEGVFVRDTENFVETLPNKEDETRILKEIREARKQADIVILSYHCHTFRDGETTLPARFTETFARECIDAGAQVFMGHGPHELQGIEKYHGGIIFYSIGNFLFETETVAKQPYDAFINKKMPLDTRVGSYMDERSKNGTVGYGTLKNIWRAVMPSVTFTDNEVSEVRLYPILLGQEKPRSKKGLPYLSHDVETLEYLAELSKPYGTEIAIEGDVGVLL